MDGRLTLGQVDRLLPPPSGLPFRLPDQRIDVADAAILLDTPAGHVALGLAGRGKLSDGFQGHLALVSRGLSFGRCAIAAPRANVAVSVADLRPSFRGPVAMDSARCGNDLGVDRPLFALEATLAPAINSWRGHSALRAAHLRAGPNNLAAVQGRVTFDGDLDRTSGTLDVASAAAAVNAFRAAATRFEGRYVVSAAPGRQSGAGRRCRRPRSFLGRQRPGRNRRSAALGARDAARADRRRAGQRLGPGVPRRRRRRGAPDPGQRPRLRRIPARGSALCDPQRRPPDQRRRRRHHLLLAERVASARRPVRSVGRRLPRDAAVAEPAADRRAARGRGADRADARRGRRGSRSPRYASTPPAAAGPASAPRCSSTGRSAAAGSAACWCLCAAISAADGLALGEGCVNASFRALQVEGLRLGPSRLPLCPIGPALVWQARGGALRAGAELRGARFAGRLGGSPIQLAANRLRVDQDGFTSANVAIRLGASSGVNRLDLATLSGRFVSRGVSGAYSGLSGRLANVPLLISEGAGRWQVVRGNLLVEGGLRVADAVDPPRFNPLASDDFRLTLVNNRIHATGSLEHPPTGTRVALATIDHNLRTGAGNAVLDVPGIAFTEGFQPEALTRLTTGVVALVEGTIAGQGRIAWDSGGTRSTGTFSTAGMNFAAPFGPVEGLTTTVEFTDLLGLTSAPGQVAEIDLVRAGIDVYDGTLVYQLRPNNHVAIESGRWPYAGGELLLQPTVLDFSQPSTKYLTFRVVGLDAARFVQLMEFSNISATGTFDGIIPMQFDQSGGRIVGGRLAARPPGGTLSYIGELTDRDLGIYGKMAFDALKELRYDRFDMTLDGDLAGEFVTTYRPRRHRPQPVDADPGAGRRDRPDGRRPRPEPARRHPVRVQHPHPGAVPGADRHRPLVRGSEPADPAGFAAPAQRLADDCQRRSG